MVYIERGKEREIIFLKVEMTSSSSSPAVGLALELQLAANEINRLKRKIADLQRSQSILVDYIDSPSASDLAAIVFEESVIEGRKNRPSILVSDTIYNAVSQGYNSMHNTRPEDFGPIDVAALLSLLARYPGYLPQFFNALDELDVLFVDGALRTRKQFYNVMVYPFVSFLAPPHRDYHPQIWEIMRDIFAVNFYNFLNPLEPQQKELTPAFASLFTRASHGVPAIFNLVYIARIGCPCFCVNFRMLLHDAFVNPKSRFFLASDQSSSSSSSLHRSLSYTSTSLHEFFLLLLTLVNSDDDLIAIASYARQGNYRDLFRLTSRERFERDIPVFVYANHLHYDCVIPNSHVAKLLPHKYYGHGVSVKKASMLAIGHRVAEVRHKINKENATYQKTIRTSVPPPPPLPPPPPVLPDDVWSIIFDYAVNDW
jgi:hypothetical protein